MSDIPFLGIDVAQDSFHATLLIGKEPNKKFRNTRKGFQQLNAWLQKHGCERVWACIEYTNKFWIKLAEYLHNEGHQVSMINPAVSAAYASGQRRGKGDKVDSRLLGTYCRDWRPRIWKPATPEQKQLKELSRAREFLKNQERACKNHLRTVEFEPVRIALREQIKRLSSQIQGLTKQLQELIETSDIKEECDRWLGIKGVGFETVAAIASEFGSLGKFKRYITLRRLAGLDSIRDESGTSVRGKEHSSKKGSKHVRAVLHMAAMSALKDNPRFREFSKRLKSKGKLGAVTVNAVANKLLLTMWSLSRSRTEFDENHTPDWLNRPRAA